MFGIVDGFHKFKNFDAFDLWDILEGEKNTKLSSFVGWHVIEDRGAWVAGRGTCNFYFSLRDFVFGIAHDRRGEWGLSWTILSEDTIILTWLESQIYVFEDYSIFYFYGEIYNA